MSVRFLHTADVHLGSPLNGLGAEDSHIQDKLRDATYEAFQRLIDLAIDRDVEFLVLSGDLYDRESRSVRANQFAAEQFRRLADADIPAYLIYGNHDPVDAGIEYVDLPNTVHEFDASRPESVIHESEGEATACLCGQSYRRKTVSERLHDAYEPSDPDLPTIGLLHTGLDPDSQRYVPCSSSELVDREEFDYWALGHIHQPRVHHRDPVVAFPGIPQGRHVNEAGMCGAYLVELEADGTCDLEFVPTGQVVWRTETVSIEGESEETEPPSKVPEIRSVLEERLLDLEPSKMRAEIDVPVREDDWTPTGIMCRWVLAGRGPAHETLTSDEEVIDMLRSELRNEYGRRSPFVWTEDVRVRTGPPLPPLEELRDDPVFERFAQTVEEIRSDEETRDHLVTSKMGTVCEWDDGSEEDQPEHLQVTDDDLDRMIDRAADLVIDELRERRME